MPVQERLAICRELTGQRRNRLHGYRAHLGNLSEGTELP
jgi:hypothetical protein